MSKIRYLCRQDYEGQEAALKVVMEQCNKWADDDENLKPIIVNIKQDIDGNNEFRPLMAAESSLPHEEDV